jgi:tRNA-2-methylthio-N6-dimethylallyladenosine synthase
VGTVEEVLLEGPAKKGESMFVGRTRGHRKVIVKANPRLVGQLLPVHIDRATSGTLFGKLELAGLSV